jgi:hypothetical protein
VSSRRITSAALLAGYLLTQAIAGVGHNAEAHACRHSGEHSHCSTAGHPHECGAQASGEMQVGRTVSQDHDCAACQFHLQSQLVAALDAGFRHDAVSPATVTQVVNEPIPALHSNHRSRAPPQIG